jgi:hypothetical protein
MGLLDPRFRYVPAMATDVTLTWRRHGFDPRLNAERRARVSQPATRAPAKSVPDDRDGGGGPATAAGS